MPICRRSCAATSTRVAAELHGVRLMFMQSNGGLTDARRFQGKDSILSGPAGGIVGAVRTSAGGGLRQDHRLRHGRHLDRRLALRRRIRARVRDPGRRRAHARADDEHPHRRRRRRLHPAFRRRALPRRPGFGRRQSRAPRATARTARSPSPTATSCSARSSRNFFRRCSAPSGDAPLDAGVVREKFAALAQEIARQTGDARTPEQVAEGYIDIAVGNMANAIKQISVQRGHDVTEYTLCCFGGAAGQHACLVADALGMTRVFIHPLAGVLSAYGMGLADITAMREQAVEVATRRGATLACCDDTLDKLALAARDEVLRQGVRNRAHPRRQARASALRRHRLRAGRRISARVADMVAQFEAAYRMRYSFLMPGRALIAEAVSVEAIGASDAPAEAAAPARTPQRRAGRCGNRQHAHRRPRALDAGLPPRRAAARRHRARPGDHRRAQRHHRRRARLAGRGDAARPPRARTRRSAPAARRHRHPRRSGDAGDLQQPLHVDRRADGPAAREHRLFGQHQGAARFFLRGVRPGGQTDRQRAAHAGASGLDGRIDHAR